MPLCCLEGPSGWVLLALQDCSCPNRCCLLIEDSPSIYLRLPPLKWDGCTTNSSYLKNVKIFQNKHIHPPPFSALSLPFSLTFLPPLSYRASHLTTSISSSFLLNLLQPLSYRASHLLTDISSSISPKLFSHHFHTEPVTSHSEVERCKPSLVPSHAASAGQEPEL